MITKEILNSKVLPLTKNGCFIVNVYLNNDNTLIGQFKYHGNWLIYDYNLNCSNAIKTLLLSRDKYQIELALNLL